MSMKTRRDYLRVAGARKRTNFAWTIRYTAVFAGFAKVSIAGSGKARRSTQQLLPNSCPESNSSRKKRTHTETYMHEHIRGGDNRFVDTADYSKDYSGHANSRAYSYQERKILGAFPTSPPGATYNP